MAITPDQLSSCLAQAMPFVPGDFSSDVQRAFLVSTLNGGFKLTERERVGGAVIAALMKIDATEAVEALARLELRTAMVETPTGDTGVDPLELIAHPIMAGWASRSLLHTLSLFVGAGEDGRASSTPEALPTALELRATEGSPEGLVLTAALSFLILQTDGSFIGVRLSYGDQRAMTSPIASTYRIAGGLLVELGAQLKGAFSEPSPITSAPLLAGATLH